MQIVIGILFVGVVLLSVDRLMLFLESRGHVNWRRKGRLDLSSEPVAELESLLVPEPGEPADAEPLERLVPQNREYAGRS
ncbi:hypothetical protein ACFOWE_22135 [Planomonospora corallina]|uniref:Uncharacterized protein n=1 Tax=Planomonospora corallina TaxID=1806052 RepID=A0ABV8IA20_9ACTN